MFEQYVIYQSKTLRVTVQKEEDKLRATVHVSLCVEERRTGL